LESARVIVLCKRCPGVAGAVFEEGDLRRGVDEMRREEDGKEGDERGGCAGLRSLSW